MPKEVLIFSLDELNRVVEKVLAYCGNKKIFAFLGELGAGKTTVIGGICHALGVKEKVSSPTFSIINEYQGKEKIFHIDLYRMKELNEAIDIGIEEYLSGDKYCFIEWPQLIRPLLPADAINIKLEIRDDLQRQMTIEFHG